MQKSYLEGLMRMTPQPSVYSKSQIIDAAVEILRQKGSSKVSARTIAQKIGSSTMPIYSHVKSMEALEKELRREAFQILKSYQQRPYTEHTLLNLAFGYVIFAREEKKLFQFLYLERAEEMAWEEDSQMKDLFFNTFGPESEAGKALLEMASPRQERLIRYSWIFTHGLATMAHSGALDSLPEQVILQYLMDAGEAFYQWESRGKE